MSDQSTNTDIGKYATINGNKKAVEEFSKELGFSVSEATVRNFNYCNTKQNVIIKKTTLLHPFIINR